MVDYLEKLGVTLREEQTCSRILYGDRNAMFSHIRPPELRQKFNSAMAGTIAHYAENVARSGVKISEHQIEEVAFRVVLYCLFVYNMWRHTYPQHKDHPLRVETKDWRHPQANNECWRYCEKEFGAEYAIYAAALNGMTLDEFSKYEKGQRAFFNR